MALLCAIGLFVVAVNGDSIGDDAELFTLALTLQSSNDVDIGEDAFNQMFWDSPEHILKRECSTCGSTHRVIYYKRYTDLSSFNLYRYTYDWESTNNVLGNDFNLFSTLEDALADTNPWQFCNYDDHNIGMFRDCGPTGAVGWEWTSRTRGGDTASFYIYTGTALSCPSGSTETGDNLNDIGGCGLTGCDARYSYSSAEQCRDACNGRSDCVSFTWAPMNGDKNHQGVTTCTLYNTITPNQEWGPSQIMCVPDVECPDGSTEVNSNLNDIGGCGLTGCDARYGYSSSGDCLNACAGRSDCNSFTWAPMNGDKNHQGVSTCTLYSGTTPNQLWGPQQIMCIPDPSLSWGGWNPGTGIAECAGDCDSDNDCAGSLQCYHDGVPPGCLGSIHHYFADYCYDPSNAGNTPPAFVVTLSAKDLAILMLCAVNVAILVAACWMCARSRIRGVGSKYQSVRMVGDSELEEVELQ